MPPFTPEDIAAIRSDPLALKIARCRVACKLCEGELRAYTGIERSKKLEVEGWVWHESLPERFRCKCGEQDFSLVPLRTGLHGVLRRNLNPIATQNISLVRLYEKTALEEHCREFLGLLDSRAPEEEVQKFLERQPVFFSRFVPQKLLFKKPVLTKYFLDFAVLDAQKQLFLIEIEKPGLQLVKKDAGVRAELQHAVDQVRKWIQEFDSHRVAALDGLGLKLDDVAKVKGVVIAGRTPKNEKHERFLRAISWGDDIEFYTFDDLLKSVTEIIRQVAAV